MLCSAANSANQSVDHRPSVLEAAPQYKHYLTAIANCPNIGSYAEDPVSSCCKPEQCVCSCLITHGCASWLCFRFLARSDKQLP